MRTEQLPQLMYRPVAAQFCNYPQPMTEMPPANTFDEYGSVNPSNIYPGSASYQPVVSNSQTAATSSASLPRSSSTSKTAPSRREHRPLVVFNPNTKTTLDLATESNKKLDVLEPTIAVTEASTDKSSESVLPVRTFQKETPVPVVTSQPEDVKEITSVVDVPINTVEHPVLDDPPTAVENGLSTAESYPETEQETESEPDSNIDSADDVILKPNQRRYDRELMVSLKDSPIARVQLKELEVVSEFYSIRRTRFPNRITQRVIRLPTGITIKRTEDAFVPHSLRKNAGELDPEKALSRELNLVLNRLSEANVSDTIKDIKKANIKTPENASMLASLIFQKAIRQLKYCKLFALVCKELRGFDVQGSEPLECLILRHVHDLFNTPLETLIVEVNSDIDKKIAETKDEDIKTMLDEDRETAIAKKTDSYYGNITFLAELYLCRLVTPKTMIDCLRKLKDSSAPESANSMITLFKICGSELDQQARSVVDSCFARLNAHMKSDKLPSHQIFKIQEIIDLRARGWKAESQATHRMPAAQPELRRNEDKLKRIVLTEPKRRSNQLNPVTPSSLAVRQQSCKSPELKPQVVNWGQGSGHLIKSFNEIASLSQPKSVPHTVVSNRSRDVSPQVSITNIPVDSRSAPALAVTSASAARLKENYPEVLKLTAPHARTVISMLKYSSKEDICDVIEECEVDERHALLHNVVEMLMDRSSSDRDSFGNALYTSLNKRAIMPEQLKLALHRFLPCCDEDWLEDYPKGLLYVAEVLQNLIQEDVDYLKIVADILQNQKSDDRCSLVFAHCLRLSSSRLGPDLIANRFKALDIDWSYFCVPTPKSFVDKYSVGFTLETSGVDAKLTELVDLIKNKASSEQIKDFFRGVLCCHVSGDFVRQCTETLISNSKDLNRQDIDQLVIGLGIIVDHKPEYESQVLLGLQSFPKKNAATDHWQKSLLDRKVISADAFQTWDKSTNGGDKTLAKNFHIRNP